MSSLGLRGLSYILSVAFLTLYGIHSVPNLAVGFAMCVVHSHGCPVPDL